VKRLACLFVMIGCGGSRPSEVSLALPAPSQTAAAPATLLGCTIVGNGERGREGEEPFPFRVFESERAIEPVLVIARPEMAHVTWSQFPERAGRGRARVAIGRQAHVRYEGFAELYGRTFTTTTRMDSVDGHLWAHAGSPIDMMSASKGDVFASVRTPFKAPSSIVVHGNCASVIYEPAPPPQRDRKPRKIAAVNDAPALRLFSTPSSARAFTTVTPSTNKLLQLEIVERKDDFVRVLGDEGHIGFDAWVLASDIRETSSGQLPGAHEARPPVIRRDDQDKRATVHRDAQLFLSDIEDAPLVVQGAFVEAGAVIRYDPTQSMTLDGRAIVPFTFDDEFIVAPEGRRLWIAKDVVSSTP